MDAISFPVLLGALALGGLLIAIEIFVTPGTGAPGIIGAILILGAVVFAFLYHGLQQGLAALAISLVVLGLGAWVAKVTVGKRLVLGEQLEDGSLTDHDLGDLPGTEGVALTDLRPAGKAQFGKRRFDVTADADFVDEGTRVVVSEVEGNRITVTARGRS